MSFLRIDLKSAPDGDIEGNVGLSDDGSFTIEALTLVIEVFAQSVGRPAHEVMADIYNYLRGKHNASIRNEGRTH